MKKCLLTLLKIGQESHLREQSRACIVLLGSLRASKEREKWLEKSYASKLFGTWAICTGLLVGPSFAQGPAATPGLSFESFKASLAPVGTAAAYPLYWISSFWSFLMQNPPAAILLSAATAAALAYVGIRNQQKVARLRETFATLNDDNWDQDVIKARRMFGEIRLELKDNPEGIAAYCNPGKEQMERAGTLQTILNDYENLALGVRLNIIDEVFLYRWMRGTLLRDWTVLSPLVTAYRRHYDNSYIYIEFEGLAMSWDQNFSFRTGRHLTRARKSIKVT